VQHILLGALRTDDGRRLLAELLHSDVPLQLERLGARFAEELKRTDHPVTDRPVDFSPRLKAITNALRHEQGRLDAELVLEKVIQALENDEEWGKRSWRRRARTSALVTNTEPSGSARYCSRSMDCAWRWGRVIGQDRAVEQVCDGFFPVLLRATASAPDAGAPRGPRAVFTFVRAPGSARHISLECLAEHFGQPGSPPACCGST